MIGRNYVIRLLRIDDKSIIPWRVRLFIAVHWLLGGLLLIYFQPGFWAGAATSGILCGLIGSSALIWEATISETDDEVTAISNEIIRGGKSRSLSEGDWGTVISFSLFAILLSFLLIPTVFTKYKTDIDSVYLVKSIILLLAYPTFIAFATYTCAKIPRVWMKSKADEIRKATDAAQKFVIVKKVLRSVGFGLIWLGALLQIPSAIAT